MEQTNPSLRASLELTFSPCGMSLPSNSAFTGTILSTFSYYFAYWCVVTVILFSMRLQFVVLCSTFVCGFAFNVYVWFLTLIYGFLSPCVVFDINMWVSV